MSVSLLRPLGFGEVLDGAFTLYRQHFTTFFVTALLVTFPATLVSVLAAGEMANPDTSGFGVVLFLLVLGVTTAIGWAALTWQVGQAVTERPFSVGEGYRHGFRAALPLIGAVVIAYFLFTILAMGVLGGGALLLSAMGLVGEGSGAAVLAVALGLIFAMLAIAVFAALFAVPATVVLERRGPWVALKRSWELSGGARLKVIGVVLISWMIVLLPTIGLYAVGAGAGMMDLSGNAASNPLWQLLEASASVLIGSLTYPFLVSAITLLYFDRRVRKEAYDLEVATEGLALRN